eukprot:m.245847 g.245847  ORF g.245847 m.245847 type:complete len:57 (-) comp33840_c11_seq2:401-571(-)
MWLLSKTTTHTFTTNVNVRAILSPLEDWSSVFILLFWVVRTLSFSLEFGHSCHSSI